MHDVIAFRSPVGPIGWLVDYFFMTRYLTALLTDRANALKDEAERRQRGCQ